MVKIMNERAIKLVNTVPVKDTPPLICSPLITFMNRILESLYKSEIHFYKVNDN